MDVISAVIGAAIGIAVSAIFIFVKSRKAKNVIGDLRVDRSDPDEPPYLFLELYDSSAMQTILKSKTVEFNVRVENYISQK